jgi:hypothetical protein
MIKRTSIFFTFLANILLFTTVIFPHHHHSSEVCFKHSHCLNEGSDGKHSTTDHRHDSKSDCCALVISIMPSPAQNIYFSFKDYVTPSYGSDILTGLFEASEEILNQAFKPDDPPWLEFSQLNNNSTHGLRAPPAV